MPIQRFRLQIVAWLVVVGCGDGVSRGGPQNPGAETGVGGSADARDAAVGGGGDSKSDGGAGTGGMGGAAGGTGGATGGTGGSGGGQGGGGARPDGAAPDVAIDDSGIVDASGADRATPDGSIFDGGGVLPPSGNPYEGARMYVNPDYVAEVETSALSSPADAALFRKVEGFSTAIWLDSIDKAKTLSKYLDDAFAQQNAAHEPVVTTVVIYDLPNRDCAANASNGELSVDNGGEARYKTEYIDPIAAVFRAHAGQRIVAIVEPDSLPNLATNLSIAKCSASQSAYRNSVAYAISALAMPHVSQYVDAAHAGWLGWDDNRSKIAQIFKDVFAAAGGADKVRGFATNVANYNILHGDDGTKLEPSNPCPDEMTYVHKLADTLSAAGIANKAFLVDTARNGRAGIRTKWGNWCNVRGAGLGERPRASPETGVDAFYWVKPPGESDGVSDSSAPRYDAMCSSADSVTGAPQAGQWFAAYFADLAHNATPQL